MKKLYLKLIDKIKRRNDSNYCNKLNWWEQRCLYNSMMKTCFFSSVNQSYYNITITCNNNNNTIIWIHLKLHCVNTMQCTDGKVWIMDNYITLLVKTYCYFFHGFTGFSYWCHGMGLHCPATRLSLTFMSFINKNATLMFFNGLQYFSNLYIFPHTYNRGRNCHQKNATKLFTHFHSDGKAKHHGSVSPFRGNSPFLVAMAVAGRNYISQNAIFCTLAHVIHGGIWERRMNRKRQQNTWR